MDRRTALLALAVMAMGVASGRGAAAEPLAPAAGSEIKFELEDTQGERSAAPISAGVGSWCSLATSCPDLCPTVLLEMPKRCTAGPMAGRVQPIFVSVDPERDTEDTPGVRKRLRRTHLAAATGTADQLDRAAKLWHRFF